MLLRFKHRLTHLLSIILASSFSFETESAILPITQTQTQLKRLDAQITNIKQNLTVVQDKRELLNQKLSVTEKHIGESISKLRSIQHSMNAKKNEIIVTQNSILKLNQQLAIHQKLLADHVIARYKMGEYQALKWILNQDDPYKINRLLTYYQYIIQSRKHLIDKIDETRKNLEKSNKKLQSELVTNQNLNSQLIQHQQQLQQNKNYNTSILKDLNSEIQNNQQNLIDVQRNKNSLTLLLKSLIQQSKVQNSEPFSRMRKKLPFPVQSKSRAYSKMNQGVTIFADEGEVVTAIYPGKIVFSDWLKGYGLLLIIDHGQGFMSLYAHNQSLFKRKGQTVRQNEQVASVGHSGGMSQNGLYFEIRQRGKAIPPLEWLS